MCSLTSLFASLFFCVLFILSVSSQEVENDGINFDPRYKREHSDGITGPVHTYVKTDKHANFKWGVRHHVGHQYAGRRRK
ncbi:hypothetical protein WA026_023754 [Henosepilachna vigintioctopunctata]|uniref:Secreted protein n=1 Tax=Henosepilachna vigintioctopunctata TaxID=420089 RepID=A0AAW1UHF3_9CUCU